MPASGKARKTEVRRANRDRRRALAKQRKRMKPSWELIPPVVRRLDQPTEPRTYEHLMDDFAAEATSPEHLVAARSPAHLQRVFADVRDSPLQGKLESLDELQRLMVRQGLPGRTFDVYDVACAGEDRPEDVAGLVRSRHLPLWVTFKVQEGALLTLEEYIARRESEGKAMKRKAVLRNKIGQTPDVQDAALPLHGSQTQPRPANFSEFKSVLLGPSGDGQRAPLNWLDLVNDTRRRMTPEAVKRVSLECILKRKEGKLDHEPFEFLLASTRGSISPTHADAMGKMTWVRVLAGAKTWYIPTNGGDNADELAQQHTMLGPNTPDHIPLHPDLQFCGVNLQEPGGYWIQDAGQKHWVHTSSEHAFLAGGFFYTAASFASSLKYARRHLFEVSTCNEAPTVADLELLRKIVDELLDDREVFTDQERDGVAFALNTLMTFSTNESGNGSKLKADDPEGLITELLDEDVQEALRKFMESAKKWVQAWTDAYVVSRRS